MSSDDDDVLGKADALLRRRSAATGTETGGVPILTDLVHDAGGAPDPSSEMAREVYSRVMAEVEGRLASELERRLIEHLVPQVHSAVASALGDLRQELANAIGDAVAEALNNRNPK